MMLYELDEIEKMALLNLVITRARADLNGGKPLTEMPAQPEREFDKIFAQLEAADYPATCNDCGAEGTNESLEDHECPKE